MGKGEIACYEQFLLFPQCFQKDSFPEAPKGGIVWEWVNWNSQHKPTQRLVYTVWQIYNVNRSNRDLCKLGQRQVVTVHQITFYCTIQTTLKRKTFEENIARKEEYTGNQHFLLFPQGFLPIQEQILSFEKHFNCRILDRSKIAPGSKRLTIPYLNCEKVPCSTSAVWQTHWFLAVDSIPLMGGMLALWKGEQEMDFSFIKESGKLV